MSAILKSCVQVFGPCCGSKRRSSDSGSTPNCDLDEDEEEDEFRNSSGGVYQRMTVVDNHLVPIGPETQLNITSAETHTVNMSGYTVTVGESQFVTASPSPPLNSINKSASSRSVPPSNNNGIVVTGVPDKLFDGLMKIVSDTLESLVFVLCPVGSVQLVRQEINGQGSSLLILIRLCHCCGSMYNVGSFI